MVGYFSFDVTSVASWKGWRILTKLSMILVLWKLQHLLLFPEFVSFLWWFVEMLHQLLAPGNDAVHFWHIESFLAVGCAPDKKCCNPNSPIAFTMFWPLSVVPPNTFSLIFQSWNIDESTFFMDSPVCSCGTSRVFRHKLFKTKLESTKCTVRDMYDQCWWLAVHKSVVMVQSLVVFNCSSIPFRTVTYICGISFVAKCVLYGNSNLGSACNNNILKLGSSTIFTGCKLSVMNFPVDCTSCWARLLFRG